MSNFKFPITDDYPLNLEESCWQEVIRQLNFCNSFSALIESNTISQLLNRYQPNLLLLEKSKKSFALVHRLYLFLNNELSESTKSVLIEEGEISRSLFDALEDVKHVMAEYSLTLDQVDVWYDQQRVKMFQRAMEIVQGHKQEKPALQEKCVTMATHVVAVRIQAQIEYGEMQYRSVRQQLAESHKRKDTIQKCLQSRRIGKVKKRRLLKELSDLVKRIKQLNAQKRQAKRIREGTEIPPLPSPQNSYHHEQAAY